MMEIKNSANQNGKRYWRSLDEFQNSPELDAAVDSEFGAAAPPAMDGVSRRRWLQLMGASMAFGASLTGCRYPAEKMAPFAFRPSGRTPGIPESFSSMVEIGGVGRPVVATCYDGRPIKLDGNPDHPDSGGGSDPFTQAMILELYDPDRSRVPVRTIDGKLVDTSWADAVNNFTSLLAGSGVAVLSEPVVSPTLARLRDRLLEQNPNAKWYEFASVSQDNALAGARMAFGQTLRSVWKLDSAKVVVTLDADPMGSDAGNTRLARDMMAARNPDGGSMSRIYAVESDFTKTGAAADHRLPLRFSQIDSFLAAIEEAVDAGSAPAAGGEFSERMLAAIVEDLLANPGASAVMVGDQQPPEVHARALRLNSKLENVGKTLALVESPAGEESGVAQLRQLVESIQAGQVTTLFVVGGNPVFAAPSDLKFDEALGSVANSAHLSVYRDETSRRCKWHLNAAHALESWGDCHSYDGSVLISQPLIEPLFGGMSAIEFLSFVTGAHEYAALGQHDHGDGHGGGAMDEARESHAGHVHQIGLQAVRETHLGNLGGDAEKAWRKAVHDGFIADSAAAGVSPTLGSLDLVSDASAWKSGWSRGDPELVFRPSSQVYDGRFANNGWLQELPEFITKLTWDNAALLSPATARALELEHGKVVNLKVGDQSISIPVYVLPGLAAGTIVAWLGYGREAAGRVAGDADYTIDSVGSDIRPLRTSGNWWSVPAVTVVRTSTSWELACTQDHFSIDTLGRNEINERMAPDGRLIREGTFADYQKFLEEHPQDGEHGHGHAEETGDDHGEGGDHEADHEEGHEGGHGHHVRWPDKHLHFENFDLTSAGWRDEEVPHKWGMSIDLSKCFGCGACVVACQAENNIPVVGKEQVTRGREMQWLRIDRYFITDEGDEEGANPNIASMPVTCQHCEAAPCETVCPVAATVHSDEGLNDMVYNRCIGTRYCGNNCPYKVRRFNYFNYTDAQTFVKLPGADRLDPADLQLQSMVMNPEVTVRSRGVMEKCTYCVQRIQNTKIKARTEGNRPIGPNEIQTACQVACSADAIRFGDLQNDHSDVAQAHANPRAYALLESLNIAPRTKFLARVVNPHPSLVKASAETAGH